MNHLIARTLTSFSLAVLLLTGAAHGQYLRHTIYLTVPFEFTVEGRSFPAGEYSILCFAPARVVVRDWRGRVLGSLISYPVQSRENGATTRLEFSTANGEHALRQIWVASDRTGYEFAPPKMTTRMAHQPPGSMHASIARDK
jgi:hypothetical protein